MTPLLSSTILRTQSDQRLVALAQAGHDAAFTTIVERYRPQLRRYCLRLVPDARADDVLQQAFMRAWASLCDGRPVRDLRPWLFSIVHNAAVTQLRRGVFDYVELVDSLQGADETAADVERRSVMRQTLAAVAALPDRQREALMAVALDDRPQSEVALEMGLTENGLRQLLFRARTTLRGAATALTPAPALMWVLRGSPAPGGVGAGAAEAVAGAGAGAGGAVALQTGTAIVVAGTLAVGGAVGLRTPSIVHRSGATPTFAAVPATAAATPPIASRRAPIALRHHAHHVAHRTVSRPAADRIGRAAPVVTLRGRRGLRVAAVVAPVGVPVLAPPAAHAAPPTVAVLQPQPADAGASAAPVSQLASAATAAPADPHGAQPDGAAPRNGDPNGHGRNQCGSGGPRSGPADPAETDGTEEADDLAEKD